MVKILYYLFKEIRPRQWIKNLVVFAAIFFTGKFFDPELLQRSILAFMVLCIASSSIYVINDLSDTEKDRLHPFKKNRPIASGKISRATGITLALILFVTGLITSFLVSTNFVFIVAAFYLLHLTYSFYLKNIILLDILAIAAGFILRVYAGEIATGYHISIWLFLTVISVALFLAIGKRRSELTLLTSWSGSITAKTRETLTHYSERMLDVYLSMFANSAWITYSFYTFIERPPILRQRLINIFEYNSLTQFTDRKWLMITIPVVLYGIMRYLQLIYEKNVGESPETVLLTDKPLIITASVLSALLFGIIYLVGK